MTVELCKKFREYLLNANQLNRTKQQVSLNSAAGYYSTVRGLLKIAYRDKWLRENINDYLDKIEPQDVKKDVYKRQVLVSVFRAPHSYTGENSTEISCHGSRYILQQVLHRFTEVGLSLIHI